MLRATLALLALVFLLVAGCGTSAPPAPVAAEPTRQDELREVGALLAAHTSEFGRGPKQAADLAKFEQGGPLGYKAVRAGEIVVVWGAAPAPEGEVAAGRAGTAVVAYDKKVPTAGGWVLLQNGTTKEMTADEFKAAPQAK